MNENLKIGIIGFGNMGFAVAQQLKTRYKIYVFDKETSKIENLESIAVFSTLSDLMKAVDIVILAVKPQDFETVLTEITHNADGKLIISIAAGITTSYIEKYLPNARIIRTMPNLPLRVRKGMICLCEGRSTNEQDLNFVVSLFSDFGKTLILSEKMMDAATAISGNGPGYLYYLCETEAVVKIEEYAKDYFIPKLIAAARSLGFSAEEARILANTTADGSIEFLRATKLSPQEARKQVASKGGSTEAGLAALQRGVSFTEAVKIACARAQELSRR